MRDVIIIGAGGGGAVVAKELCERGLDVLLLEGGGHRVDPERDSRLEADANSPLTGYLRFGPGDRRRGAWLRDLPQHSAVSQVSGVGGTTQHYFGNSPRAMPGVFRGYSGADAGAYDRAHEFPFGYRELVPYYEWVERTLPVETAPMGLREDVFFRAAQRIGLAVQTGKDITRAAFRPQENAILQPRGMAGRTADPALLTFPMAQGCTFCSHCIQGCSMPRRAPRNLKAKRSTDNSYVPMALTADLWAEHGRAVTLVSNAFVTRIHTDSQSVARAVTWRDARTGETHTEDARVIVLACGAVETPRLWLASGLPNTSDQVGRGLTDHFVDGVVGIMPEDVGGTRAVGSAARADFPGRGMLMQATMHPAFLASALCFSDAGIAGAYTNGLQPHPQGADTVGRLIGPALKATLADIDRVMVIATFTDDDVERGNRVTLSAALPPDEHGAVARVEVRHRSRSARTVANREFLARQAVRVLRAAGARSVHRVHTPAWLFHIHSTMRMGDDPASSVVDASGEAHEVRRLFVADNSSLSNALGGPNPTLTMQALSTRAAERIFQRYFGGSGWVHDGAPVCSTDPAVTRAVIRRGL